jgi:hypothetical protein
MNEEVVKEKALHAIKMLIEREKDVIDLDVNERTLSHRLAVYLESQFDLFNVDCEYNKYNDAVKKVKYETCDYLRDESAKSDDEFAKTVYPDIIVHKRISKLNLLVIEMKKNTNYTPNECDIQKLKAYKSELGYQYAAFVRIGVNNAISEGYYIEWI